MIQRLLTSFIGVLIFFAVLLSPAPVMYAAVLIVALGAIYELHRAVTKNTAVLAIGLISLVLIYFGFITDNIMIMFFNVFALYMILSIAVFGKEKVYKVYMLGFTTVIVTTFLTTVSCLRREFGVFEAFLPFLFAWITDSAAYFVGKTFGKTKLAPNLSPKKTVEGSLGGIAACVVCSLLYVLILDKAFSYQIFPKMQYVYMVFVALTASVASQLGDLALSAIKRDFDIKDYGKILPGHGGILDRFDSVLFAAPVVYCIFLMF